MPGSFAVVSSRPFKSRRGAEARFCQSNEWHRVQAEASAARSKHRAAFQRPCRGGRATFRGAAASRAPGARPRITPRAAALTAPEPARARAHPPPAASYAEPRAGGSAARCPGAPRPLALPLDPSPWQRRHSPSSPRSPPEPPSPPQRCRAAGAGGTVR